MLMLLLSEMLAFLLIPVSSLGNAGVGGGGESVKWILNRVTRLDS